MLPLIIHLISIKNMAKAVLSAAPKLATSRIATIASGNYVFVGFKKHVMKIKNTKTNAVDERPTFAPVLAKLDANNNAVGLYMVNRSDLYSLANPRSEWQKPEVVHNNSGSFIEAMDQIVGNTDGYFPEALWMNRALPKFRNTVLSVETIQFTGTSAAGNVWRGAKVYKIDITSNTNWQGHSTLSTLIQAKNWSTDECIGFSELYTDVEFEFTDPRTNQVKKFSCTDCKTLPA